MNRVRWPAGTTMRDRTVAMLAISTVTGVLTVAILIFALLVNGVTIYIFAGLGTAWLVADAVTAAYNWRWGR